ncbi:uncharacterized protein [Nicotiana sylvestris]|uniref:uncharacterized protein n=1 Tax=Nicotiana sylvestris TaxID=4096 RepID=UPI00388C405B
MDNNDEIELLTDNPQGQSAEQESEEISKLRQQLSDVYQAWVSGQPPPQGLSKGTSTVPRATQPLLHVASDHVLPPGVSSPYNQTPQYESPAENEKPAKTSEPNEMARKMKSLEQNIKNIQGIGGHKSVSFSDLCMFPHIYLPPGFKTPKFEKYDGHGDPIAHLKRYCNQLRGAGGKEELLMAYFGESHIGVASEWFIDQDISHWHVWDDMAQAFVKQFQYNIDIAPNRNSLSNMKKTPTESFREYAIKWREQAARVKPPMDNHELITVFLEAQEPDYFQNMMSAMGRPFAEAIKIGEMVENGLKTGRIIRAPDPRNPRPQQQNFRAPYNVRPRQDYGREQRPMEKFTPLAKLYSSLFQKLKQMGMIGPIAPHHMHPDTHEFQANDRCEYHSGAPGHSTDDCWTLKRAIERLITEKLIVVTNGEDPPNVTNNPLPAHNDVHFVGMIGRDQEHKPFYRAEMTVGTIQEGTKRDVSLSRDVPLIVKGALSSENVTLFVPKVMRLEVRSNVPSPRLYVLEGHPITRQNQGSTKGITKPIIIRPAVQTPVTNTKTIPWNYNKTVMTYKGKEIIEEVGETGGLTRSGRCYSPEELRKAKQIREGQLPIKKSVTEEEAEEFLKKMKVHDYSIIDQLRKTPAQISLQSLLLHSKEMHVY